jgi:predicted PurR-regulated permease PerM
MTNANYDLARITLGVLFIAGLIGASLWILQPFIPAVVWATTLVIATWPIMRRVQELLWQRRGLAVLAMTLALLVIFVLPFWLAISTIIENAGTIIHWVEWAATADFPSPPAWLANIPLVGESATQAWLKLGDSGYRGLLSRMAPYAGSITQWLIATMGGVGSTFLQILLTVAISAILFAKGEQAGNTVVRFGVRLAGMRGKQSVSLAAQAIRGVALGVVVTAFLQSAVAGAGLLITGVPFASILCAIAFMLCIAQIGPAPILIPAVVWMYARSDASWATLLLVFSVVAIGMDNVIRPILIRRGADLPLLLILAGVIGGLLAFGLIGIFLGPTILAVAYTLLGAWIAEGNPLAHEVSGNLHDVKEVE